MKLVVEYYIGNYPPAKEHPRSIEFIFGVYQVSVISFSSVISSKFPFSYERLECTI